MKMKLMVAALLASVGTLATAANDGPYYGLQGSVIFPDQLRNNEDGYGANVLFGLPVTPHLAVELNLFGLRMEKKTNGSDKEVGAGLDLAFYPFTRARVFAPFLLIGSGAQYEDRNGPSRGYSFHDAGLGFLVSLTDDQKVSLRVDAKRYRINDNELIPGRDQLWDTRLNAGVQVSFGADAPAAVAPPPPAPPAPPAAPLDSDGDGVIDPNDACPGTPVGLKVDERGCAIKEAKIVLRDINFEFNSANLTAESKASLDKVVAGLSGQPTMNLLIEGHTDSVGTDAYNLTLSKQRAASARAYLIEKGIEGKRIESTGFGESKPVASNKTAEGRAENRRVEFKVTKE